MECLDALDLFHFLEGPELELTRLMSCHKVGIVPINVKGPAG